MFSQEPEMMHSSMLTNTLRSHVSDDTEDELERGETLKRADEALRRANKWVEWMETQENQSTQRRYEITLNPRTGGFAVTGGRLGR
jgi:hypothetical protein